MDTKVIRQTLEPVFVRSGGTVVFAYLFGSVLHETSPLSDIDIAVYLTDGTDTSLFDARMALYADFCRALKRNDIRSGAIWT